MKKLALIFAVITAGLYSGACSNDEGDVSSFYAQGINIVEFSPGQSFKAVYVKGDDMIVLDAQRGKSTPAEYSSDPTVPKFEIDTRITDAEGRLLYIRRGGDDFNDPTWMDDIIWQDALPADPRGNRHLFELVIEAADKLGPALEKEGAELGEEVAAFRQFAATLPETLARSEEVFTEKLNDIGVDVTKPLAGGGGTDGPEDAPKDLTSGWYFISVHDKSITFTFGTGRHSATRISKYAGPNSYTYFDFCNHGTCAGDMGHKCSLSMIHKPDWTALTCNTGYSTYSNDGHNCHDDTRTQMAAFVYGPVQARNQFWCGDGDSDVDLSGGFEEGGSPDCNDGTNSGYNHPSMHNFSESNTASATVSTTQFSVVLSANVSYTISTCGSTSTDTYLRLKTGETQVAFNDDGCGLQSSITHTPAMTGTYIIHAGCFGSNSCSGKVHIKMNSSSSSPNYYSASATSSATVNTYDYNFALEAGTTYKISTCGSTSTDTYLRLYSGSTQMAYNDDGCGLQSSISFTPTLTGTYTVKAGCFSSGTCSGVVSVVRTGNVCVPASDNLCPNESLLVNQYRTSANGAYRLTYQGDGNLVLYRLSDWYPMWSTGSNSSPAQVIMQDDGNLVVYRSPWAAQWSSNTWLGGGSGHYLVVQNDGVVNMYNPAGAVVWSTK
ncbi:pre-peptidase C-terminal domain-containing protein [Myxococcota bacterium]|nr:pre-peptidase C-terminal domain-containing protein [Myxococcota bacterium]MBU1380208.1 pre-peptidase C-terminal domain-containing protein [Myxococcota bacterium]MBU1498386.1 pre-peptidase C-terminal domain-containing protein [Myxococcota bacterium]